MAYLRFFIFAVIISIPIANSTGQPDQNELIKYISNISQESGLILHYADRISSTRRGNTVQWYVNEAAPKCAPLYKAFGGVDKMKELGIRYVHVFEPLPNGYYSWPVDLNDNESVELTY